LEVLNAIRQAAPNVIARDKYFRSSGVGELHSFDAIDESADRDLGKDAVVEMFLLEDVETLICYPPDSYFSYYARRKGNGRKLTLPIDHSSQDELIPIADHLC